MVKSTLTFITLAMEIFVIITAMSMYNKYRIQYRISK